MVESITIDKSNDTPEPTLEEQARAAGIDPTGIDPTATSQTAEPRPAWLPPKFKTPADMAAAYAELERKQSSQKTAEPQPDSNEAEDVEEDDDKTEDNNEEVEKTVEKATGLNFDELATEFWSNNETLADERYEQLEQAGIPRSYVDAFIEGQKAIVNQTRNSVFTAVGGEGNYEKMLTWAAKSMSEAEVNAYNDAVNGNDMNKVMLAVNGLKARYETQVGFEPTREIGGKTKASNDVYESIAQLQTDMSNPKYYKDEAFRARVEAKLSRSDIL
jgi:hypothetical protein